MHLYRDDKHPINAWNAVDVLVDGLLQHGHVVNVAKDGLIIDFHCAGQRAQLIKYGRIFRFPSSSSSIISDDTLPPATAVQVLLHHPPDGAWIWYHGTIVGLADYLNKSFECVQVPLLDAIQELVPRGQVRPPPADGDREGCRVMEKDFVVRCARLPDACAADGSQLVREIFQKKLARGFNIVCVSLSVPKRTLQYLQRQDARPLKSKDLEEVYTCSQLNGTRPSPSRSEHEAAASITAPPGDGDGIPLPPVLLLEVFRSLDSIRRVRCRRVCALWNTLLITDGYFPDVRVSGNAEYGVLPYYADDYLVTACLLKRLTRATAVVVLANLGSHNEPNHLISLIDHIIDGSRLRAVVFHQCEFSLNLGLTFPHLMGDITSLVMGCSKCGQVIMKNCRIYDIHLEAVVTQHVFTMPSYEQTEIRMWDLFERGLVLDKPVNREALVEWIDGWLAQYAMNEDDGMEELILTTLCYYQGSDPRPSTHYRDHPWTMLNLSDLDVTKLTTLTGTALYEARERLSPR
ncbi:uncharacterized protein LOC129587588 [Paramacrobiotus metropolitanus]|uniref:uncharacterized protein LOC129587588 n=1 Tax=Paramacrobiotus metropolitanus TaxID=2943436 RepID=UPI002445BE85|nr:uncharacterized protein LOC129587588 [Paramacrobiotus metropolitanus]